MKALFQRRLRGMAVLATLGALAWAIQTVMAPEVSGSAVPSAVDEAPPLSHVAPAGFTDVAKSVAPAVVNITRIPEPVSRSSHEFRDQFRDHQEWEEWMKRFFESPRRPPMPPGPHQPFRPWGPPSQGMGSGVIVSPDGYILTNHHVVEGTHEVTVSLPDKREFAGTVVGVDPKTDLAVIKIDGRALPYVPWGDSSKLRVGEPVLAVGNPFGLTSTVTQGIVSAKGRARMGITEYEDFIQTDAAINPGNSGGALVNTKGELVGINTAIFSRTGGYQGIGLAIPTSLAQPVYESLVRTGRVVRGYLGIGIQEVTKDLADSFDLKEPKGALVGDVKQGSPADRAGIQRGDVIVAYKGEPVADPVALQRMVTNSDVGTDSHITVTRDGKEKVLAVTIGEQPEPIKIARAAQEQGEHALTGLAVKDLDARTAREFGLPGQASGVVVVGVRPGSGADQAGLNTGDVIREINKKQVTSVQEFEKIASGLEKGEKVLLLINRRGASLFVSVKV